MPPLPIASLHYLFTLQKNWR